MQIYKHTQIGVLMIAILGGIALFALGIAGFVAPEEQGARTITRSVTVVVVLLVFLFGTLTTEVGSGRIVLHFGPGLIHRTIALTDVSTARVVRNRWWYGWGIRLTPHGWLWNVSGFDAVELEFVSGRKFRIGTDKSSELLAAIERGIRACSTTRAQ